MLRRNAFFVWALLLTSTPLLSQAVARINDWQDSEIIEQFLAQAEVVESTELGVGITGSVQVTLQQQGRIEQAIFKDFDRPGDSWRREVAAYKLDRLLGLGMVPPTVERSYHGHRGGLQLWVEGVTLEVADIPVDLDEWRRQVSEMWLFDYLTGNIDRHVRNALMTPDGRLVLIDNSKAFQTYPQILSGISTAKGATRARFWMTEYDPSQQVYDTTYRQELLDRLRSLTKQSLDKEIGRWVAPGERRSLLERRDVILRQLEVP